MKFLVTSFLLAGSAVAFAPSKSSHQNIAGRRTNTVELSLWGEPTQKDGETGDKSKALPFAPRPKILDGTMAGDVGFE
jgi:hypothetical protein